AAAAGTPYAVADPVPRALVAAAFGCLEAAQQTALDAAEGEPTAVAPYLDRAMDALTSLDGPGGTTGRSSRRARRPTGSPTCRTGGGPTGPPPAGQAYQASVNSARSMRPSLSWSALPKICSRSLSVASSPRAAMAWRNSSAVMRPSPSPSNSTNVRVSSSSAVVSAPMGSYLRVGEQ